MKQTILILSMSMILLAGCKRELGVADDGTVRFAAYQPAGANTKVTGTSFDAGDEIAVFAPLAGNPINGNYDNGGVGPAKGKRYVADNSNNFNPAAESERIRYTASTTRLDFYAVYPAIGPAPKRAPIDLTTYKVDLGDITDQRVVGNVVPYMYSNDARDKGPGSGIIPLTFRYVFSKVSISVSYDPGVTGDTLSKVEMFADDGLFAECVIDLTREDAARLATNGGRNVLANGANPYVFKTPLKEESQTLGYLLPGVTVKPMIRLTFGEPTIQIETGGSSTTVGKVYLCPVPVRQTAGRFEAGKEYIYKVEIGTGQEVKIGGTIEDWEVIGAPPIVAE